MRIAPIALCFVFAWISGCGAAIDCKQPENASTAKCTIINSVIDCGKAIAPDAESAAISDLNELIKKATGSNGVVDLSVVEMQLESLGIKYGGCTVASLFAHFTSGKVGAVAGAGPTIPPEAAKQEFNLLRARLWPGYGFHTAGGDL